MRIVYLRSTVPGFALRCWRFDRGSIPAADEPIAVLEDRYRLALLAREALRDDVKRRNAQLQRAYATIRR